MRSQMKFDVGLRRVKLLFVFYLLDKLRNGSSASSHKPREEPCFTSSLFNEFVPYVT